MVAADALGGRALAVTSDALVGGYLVTCVLAGVNGALRAGADTRRIAGADVGRELTAVEAASLLSTWRFLRALEAGFGALCLADWRRLHEEPARGRDFALAMGAGVAARLVGRLADGRPNALPYVVGGLEAAGLGAFLARRRRR